MSPENNKYRLEPFIGADGVALEQEVIFYKMNLDGTSEPGTTLEQMLIVSIARLNDLDKRFPCRENALAITKMEEALMWLNKRTENRISRGVEGKHII
ncbi:MAG: ABC transporter ATPase [Promethearchaeota archaeon CR_4]|nr:MAG: ABC transporter ATPase [Candidatus Lokiarchaeota archaeon CR_4]